MTDGRLDRLLQQCTVRLHVSNRQGTGFFVAPGLILTCAHVVETVELAQINVFWKEQNQHYTAEVINILKDFNIDLALLKLTSEEPDHPCIYFDSSTPELDDSLFSFGYPEDNPDGDPVTCKYEGESFRGTASLHKLKAGQFNYGSSGSPLLNQRTGAVCGIINISRNPNTDLGGRAVPTKVILSVFPELIELNSQFHQKHGFWLSILLKQENFSNSTVNIKRTEEDSASKNELSEYLFEVERYISESYGRNQSIDLRCEKNLNLLRERLNLSFQEVANIDDEILRFCREADQRLQEASQKYRQELVLLFQTLPETDVDNEKRRIMRERQEAIGLEERAAGLTLSILGNESLKAGNLETAIIQFKDAIRQNSNDASAHTGLAVTLYRQEKLTEALESLRTARDLYEMQTMSKRAKELDKFIQLIERNNKSNLFKRFLNFLLPKPPLS